MKQTCSVLTDIKKMLSVLEDDHSFDVDIKIHINSALANLNQFGVGPVDGLEIESEATTWEDLFKFEDKNLNMVKSYIYLKVRLLFDPPTTSFALDSFQKQIDQMEWRFTIMPTTTTPEGRKNFHGYDPELPVRSLESLYADTAGDDD